MPGMAGSREARERTRLPVKLAHTSRESDGCAREAGVCVCGTAERTFVCVCIRLHTFASVRIAGAVPCGSRVDASNATDEKKQESKKLPGCTFQKFDRFSNDNKLLCPRPL